MAFLERLFGPRPAVEVWIYTANGRTTIRGQLVGRYRDCFEVAAASVAPEGSETFKPVIGRVLVDRANIDWWTEKR